MHNPFLVATIDVRSPGQKQQEIFIYGLLLLTLQYVAE